MSLSLRSLSSHHPHLHVRATGAPAATDANGLDDPLSSASNSDPSSSDPSSPTIDASNVGQASGAFAALLNQLLTEGPTSASSTTSDAGAPAAGLARSPSSGDGTASLDALLQAATNAPASGA